MQDKIQKILDKNELLVIKKLNNPHKVQDFLDTLPFNFELNGETYMSPRRVLQGKKAHCFEGAMLATLCLTYHGFKNYIVDLKVKKSAVDDFDHIVCIFKINNYWGAISKTNHSVLRWRDPIYKSVRELLMSYFHEYFLDDGGKTLASYSKPYDVFKKFGVGWLTAEEDLDQIALSLDRSAHLEFVPKVNKKLIRKVGRTEVRGAMMVEWDKNGKKSQKIV